MKIKSILNKIKAIPKKYLALIAVMAVSLPMALGIVSAATQVLMEGNVTALNVTAGETTYKDSTNAKVDDVVQVQLWHHNREMPNTNKANNTVVKFNVPTAKGKSQIITGTSSSDNGNTISDTTLVNLSLDNAYLKYVPGSAKFKYNKGAADGKAECITGLNFPPASCFAIVSIPDSVVTTGVNLDKYRGGPLNGCNAYHETVIIQVRSMADAVSVNKYVRHVGQTSADWKTSTTAKPGDDLEYMIKFKNEGNTTLNNVAVADNMPKYNSYVAGSTKLMNGTYPNGTTVNSDNITTGGINVGNYLPGGVGYVLMRVKLDPKTAYDHCGTYDVRNVGIVRPQGMNEVYNTAQVIINVDGCTTTTPPTYSCDMLKAEKLGDRKVKFTTTASAANGASIVKYVYTYGDGSVAEVNAPTNTAEHTYAADGTYNAKVQVVVSVNGTTKTVDGANCVAKVDFKTPTPDFKIEKGVRMAGSNSSYVQDLTLKYGDKVQYQVLVTNTGETDLKNVVVKDTLPAGVAYEAGSLKVNGASSNADLFGAGVTIPSIAKGAKAEVTFIAQVNKLDGVNCDLKTYRNLASADPEGTGTGLDPKEDDVNVKANCENPTPKYSCDMLEVTKNGGRTISVNVSASASGGAVIKRFTYVFGDGGEITTDKNTVEHTYSKDGKYIVRAKVLVGVGNETITVESDNCAKVVEFTSTPMCTVKGKENLPADSKDCKEVPPSTPPTTLPDTGAGSVVAIFAVVAGVASYGYYVLAGRRQ